MSAAGVYGLRLLGLPEDAGVRRAVLEAPSDWPTVRLKLEASAGTGSRVREHTPGRVALPLPHGGRAVMERASRTATIACREGYGYDWLIHPALAYVASVYSTWLGRRAFHAGAFVVDGGAWGLLGGHESGKSTTLGYLSRAGYAVLADDMVVLDGLRAFAGPRSIDLRPRSAQALRVNGDATAVRAGGRQRLIAAATATEYPLRGWFVLAWGASLAERLLPVSERLSALAGHSHPVVRREALRMLDLLALPAFEVSRPKDLGSLPATADSLVRTARAG